MSRVSLLSLNIRHAQGGFKTAAEKEWSLFTSNAAMRQNAVAIAGALKEQGRVPDVLCLQEGNATAPWWPDVIAIIADELGYPHRALAARRILPHNNAVLARMPMRRAFSKQFLLTNRRPWPGMLSILAALNRGFAATDIEGLGTVFSTHLQPYDLGRRVAEARWLRAGIRDAWNESNGRIIVAGDLNIESVHEPTLEIIRGAEEPPEFQLTTMPPINEAAYRSFATWPDTGDARAADGSRLDYVFASPALALAASERVSTHLTDHWGVWTEIEAPE